MIKGDRPTAPPAHLIGQSAINEKAKVQGYYANTPTGFPAYDQFSVYRHETVKDELGRMFRWKCAYCESQFVNHGVHVEHFRPKGAVQLTRGGVAQIGYWWLGSEWKNLLPTCSDCNTEATHTLPDGSKKKVGKGNYFPLAAGQTCAPSAGYLHTETALLIDPSETNPIPYFEFIVATGRNKTYSLIRPKKSDAFGHERAELSIDAYALNRHRLVVQRTARLSEFEAELLAWRNQLCMLEAISDVGKKRHFATLVQEQLKSIFEKYVSPDKHYSAACAAFAKDWLHSHKLDNVKPILQNEAYANGV